jgi:hypothetical protein
MSIDEIVNMYRNGYTVEENVTNLNPKIVSAQDGIAVSTGAMLLIGLGIVAYMYLKK